MAQAASRFEVGLLYAAAALQGLALVSFPAASAILVSPDGFALSGTQYGAMFVPQVAMAILASSLGPRLSRRLGLRAVLLIGLCSDLLSMLLFSLSALAMGSAAAFVLLCIATGAVGLGFGATVMALNTFVEGYFPARADAAVLSLNALVGLGNALAPVLSAAFSRLGAWWALPVLVGVLLCGLLLFALRASLRLPYEAAGGESGMPPRFWVYVVALVLYGIVETLPGNWATIYLSKERHLSAEAASFALTAFWIALTLGRILFAFLSRFVRPALIFVVLPFLLAASFLFASGAGSAASGIAAFAAAGLACSAFMPLSISFGGREFPSRAATMSGQLICSYLVGYGIAAFGVGPLVGDLGLTFAAVYALGGVVALALGVVAIALIRRPAKVPA